MEDDHADVVAPGGLVGGAVQLRLHIAVEDVERGAVEPDDGHRAGQQFEADLAGRCGLLLRRLLFHHAHSRPPLTSSTWPLT
ncbi:hypothetical protein GCM10020000_29610 [Streptomyces olivoverticillatus]